MKNPDTKKILFLGIFLLFLYKKIWSMWLKYKIYILAANFLRVCTTNMSARDGIRDIYCSTEIDGIKNSKDLFLHLLPASAPVPVSHCPFPFLRPFLFPFHPITLPLSQRKGKVIVGSRREVGEEVGGKRGERGGGRLRRRGSWAEKAHLHLY